MESTIFHLCCSALLHQEIPQNSVKRLKAAFSYDALEEQERGLSSGSFLVLLPRFPPPLFNHLLPWGGEEGEVAN